MNHHARIASPTRPRHRSRPELERLEGRLQPNRLGGLWDDLALGLPMVDRPRAPEVASVREHHAHGLQARHATTPPSWPARPIAARTHRLTTPSESQLPIMISVIPTTTSPTLVLSPGTAPTASLARVPSSPVPAAPTARPGPTATQPRATQAAAAPTPGPSPAPAPTAPAPAAPTTSTPTPSPAPLMGGTSSGWTPFADGSGGYGITNWGSYGSAAGAIAMWTVPNSTTQRIVTAGAIVSKSTGIANPIAVARYNTDGTLDTGFGSGGIASSVQGLQEGLSAVTLQSNGAVVGAGRIVGKSTSDDVLVARYTVNGALDTTFNGTGWVSTDINRSVNRATSVGIQSTGKIIVAGYNWGSSVDSVILRYTSAGKLDSGSGGFGQAGKNGSPLGYTIMSMGSAGQAEDQINALAIQPDDKIVTVGYATDPNAVNSQLTLMRFTATGSPDPTFNGGSPVLLPPSIPGWSEGYAVALQPVTVNGQKQTDIVVAGDAGPAGISGNSPGFYQNFLVARFNPDGSPDTSFNNGSGSISVPIPSGSFAKASGVALDNFGNIVVGGTWGTSPGSTSGVAVVRLAPNGTLDTTFNSSGANPGIKSEAIPGHANATASALAIGSDGNYYLAGSVQLPTGYPETLLAYFSP